MNPHATTRVLRLTVIALLAVAGAASTQPARHALAATVTYTVNTTADTHDAGLGDGTCADSSGNCSLRAALEEIGADVAGSYIVDIPDPGGNHTYGLTLGELDLEVSSGDSIELHGESTATNVIINQTTSNRVLNINQPGLSNVQVTLDNLTLSGGSLSSGNTIGAAVAAFGSGNTDLLTLTNMIVTNNNAGCGGEGGGVFTQALDLAVSDSVFSSNQAEVGGGIAFSTGGTFNSTYSATITNSTFTGNLDTCDTAGTSGGGGALFLSANFPATFTVNNNSFTGNTNQFGAAVAQAGGALTGYGNRFYDNTDGPSTLPTTVQVNNTGTADWRNNWWGCNTGPNTSGCPLISPFVSSDPASLTAGQIAFKPWITVALSPNPSFITPGGATTLALSALQNSAGQTLTASQVGGMAGVAVNWITASNGSLSNEDSAIQSSSPNTGVAHATFTGNGTCSQGAAKVGIDLTAVQTTIPVHCPNLTSAVTDNVSGKTTPNTSWTWTFHIANTGTGDATFGGSDTVFAAVLPSANLIYTSGPSPAPFNETGTSGALTCTITSSVLSCIPLITSFTLNSGGSFDVAVTLFATSTGTYSVPDSGGSCGVDPNNVVLESNESDNTCSDSVVVSSSTHALISRAWLSGRTIHWRVSSNAGIAGFYLTAGAQRLDARLIPVHVSRSYRYTTSRTPESAVTLHTVLTSGNEIQSLIR